MECFELPEVFDSGVLEESFGGVGPTGSFGGNFFDSGVCAVLEFSDLGESTEKLTAIGLFRANGSSKRGCAGPVFVSIR